MNHIHRVSIQVVTTALSAAAAVAQVSVSPLLSTGQPAPGFPDGATILSLGQPGVLDLVNDRGHAWAYGIATGGGVTGLNDQGLWLLGPNMMQLLWREGEPAPGLDAGIVFGPLNRVVGIASDDSLVMWVNLSGPGVTFSNDSAIYRVAAGASPQLIIREGDPAPGLPGTPFPPPRQMTRYHDNQVAMHSAVSAGFHIWISTPSGVQHAIGTGDDVPGYPGATFSNPGIVQTLGGGAELGFTSGVLSGPPGSTNSVCRLDSEGGVDVLILSGQPAEGIGGDVTYSNVGLGFSSGIDDPRGAALATLTGPGVSSANDQAVYRFAADGPVLAWREGDALPEIGEGVTFSGSPSFTPTAQDVYVSAMLAGSGIDTNNNASIWRMSGASRTLVARENEPAADLPSDVLYAEFTFFSNDYSLVTNQAGRLMFVAGLRGNITNDNNMGLFVMDPLGQVRLALRKGDVIQTSAGDARTVLGFTAGGMNERGAVVVQIQYAANTGSGLHLLQVGCPAAGCESVDVNGDCRVELQDLAALLAEFGTTGDNRAADTDRDGDVDLQDLAALLAAFGNECGGG